MAPIEMEAADRPGTLDLLKDTCREAVTEPVFVSDECWGLLEIYGVA